MAITTKLNTSYDIINTLNIDDISYNTKSNSLTDLYDEWITKIDSGTTWVTSSFPTSSTTISDGKSICAQNSDKRIEALEREKVILQNQIDELNTKFKQLEAICRVLINQVESNY